MRKDVRPKKRSLFHGPPPACHSCLPISPAVSGPNLMFTNDCLGFKTFQIRRTAGSGNMNTLEELPGFKEEPVVIWLILIAFVDHGVIHLKSGYLIFLRIVMMNLQNRHDTQQGFVQFIIPAQQWSTSWVSHRSSQDSLPRHHLCIYLQIDVMGSHLDQLCMPHYLLCKTIFICWVYTILRKCHIKKVSIRSNFQNKL